MTVVKVGWAQGEDTWEWVLDQRQAGKKGTRTWYEPNYFSSTHTIVNPSPHRLRLSEVQSLPTGFSSNITRDPQPRACESARWMLPTGTLQQTVLQVWPWKHDSLLFHSWLPESTSLCHSRSSPTVRTWTVQDIQRNALEVVYHLQGLACIPTMDRWHALLSGPGFFCQVWEKVITFKEVLCQNCPKLQTSFVWSKRWARC